MTANPSTQWQEQIHDWEESWHAELTEQLVAMQSRFNEKFGPGRALHRRQIAGLHGTFEVRSDLPEYLRQGVFAESATYECLIRLSDGSPGVTRDATPDVHGFAISLRGVSGEGALGSETDRQDFLLINHRVFGFATSREFGSLVPHAAKSQAAVVKYMIKTYGPLKGAAVAAALAKDMAKPFFGYGTSKFYSAVPIRFGPHAVRLRLNPHQTNAKLGAVLDYSGDIVNRLDTADLSYDLDVQFFVDEESTPIEDGTVDWPEEVSPFVTVGTLALPTQDCASEDGQELAKEVEEDHFDPWQALVAHRPLGEIMRARKATYYASTQNR